MRASLCDVDRYRIYPKHYMRFGSYRRQINGRSYHGIRKYIISVINDFISSGVSRDDCNLCANYVLTALTTVCTAAAQALPWLYESTQESDFNYVDDPGTYESSPVSPSPQQRLPLTFSTTSASRVIMVGYQDLFSEVCDKIRELFDLRGDLGLICNSGEVKDMSELMNDSNGIIFVTECGMED